jgi:hypothetical protein
MPTAIPNRARVAAREAVEYGDAGEIHWIQSERKTL